MSLYLLIGTILWLYVLSVLKRARLSAFMFIVGSAGLFFILMGFAQPYWVWFFTHAVIHGESLFGLITHWCQVILRTGAVYIPTAMGSVTMRIDFECSGIIETAALVSLICFFPTYARREKLFYAVFGTLFIYLANIIRLSVVVTIVHFAGADSYFVAHAIIGRLVFYVLVIALYYNVFTYSQLAQGVYRELVGRRLDRKSQQN
ncbi:exosortase family protein XrtG [Lacticaseibacillus zhaodongensis]|uniref:exosortase family protein XrtG n=1 Tax=Lacticaseibacillus zhaodongensis TaxID=2668065 RepID=UPI0012D31DEA|nr:exosortase family protein XrtG [Lacticaseibacillus zhaodongensis]